MKNILNNPFVVRLSLIFLVVIFPFFFIGGPSIHSGPLFKSLWNCGHLIFFFVAPIYIHSIYPLSTWRRWLLFSFFIFCLGESIEIIQGFIGREEDWNDVLRDLAGAWLGLFLLQPGHWSVWSLRVISVGFMWPTFLDVYHAGRIEYYAKKDFPLLAGFEEPTDLKRWRGRISLSNEYVSQGNHSLLIHFSTAEYSNVKLNKCLGDWRGFKNLAVDIYNPQSENLELVLRIHDVQHELGSNNINDRFNTHLNLNPGWNQLSFSLDQIQQVPKGRLMDLSQLMTVEIFSAHLSKPKDIYLDNLRLE